MKRAVQQLIGAGLTSVMPGFGLAVPDGAIERGAALFDMLERKVKPAAALLERLTQALLHERQRAGLARDVADRHMMALPGLMDRNRPPVELIQAVLIAAQTQPAAGAADNAAAEQLAAEIVALALNGEDEGRAGLDDTTLFVLLERLYVALAAESVAIDAVRPMCADYLSKRGWVAPPASPQPPPLPPAARLQPAAIAALRANVERRRNKLPDVEATAARQAALLVDLIDRLTAHAESNPGVSRELMAAAQHLKDGVFLEAERALANAEQHFTQLAQSNLGTARDRMRAAAEILAFRAELEEVRLDFRKAARHYRSALRCLTKLDVARQWQCMMRHAQALLRLDEIDQDEGALAEAAKIYAEASRLHPDQVGALAWAKGEAKLASFLINLGEREKSPQRFAEAIDHARAACGVLVVEPAGEAWLEGQTTLARALWLCGDLSGNANLLGEAAAACRIVRDRLARDKMPSEWLATTALLGRTLLRQATLTGTDTQFAEATESLRAALQFAETARLAHDAANLEACLGRSLLAQFTSNDQLFLVDLAATAFRRAIKAAHAKGAPAEKAVLQHELGMTLWMMAERTSDSSSLEAAAEALEQSATALEGLGDQGRAGEVRRDIGRLREASISK